MVDLRTTARRQVPLTNIGSIVFGFAMFAMSLVLLQLPEGTGYGLGQSMLVVGLVMGPSSLVMMAMAPISARISKARGPKVTLILGAVVVSAGYVVSILLMSEIWHLVLVSTIIGAGIGLAYGAMPGLVMAAVPVTETAAANSLNTLMRYIGTATASAVAGAILAQLTVNFGALTVPSQNGFRLTMTIGAGAALAMAAFLPRKANTAATRKGRTTAHARAGR